MRNFPIKILYSGIICALLMLLCACHDNNSVDWEDTLPSASTRKTSDTVQVIIQDTSKPISLDEDALEQVTTITTTTRGLATTTADDDIDIDTPPVTDVPSVPMENYTTAIVTPVTSAPITNTTTESNTNATISQETTTSTITQESVISNINLSSESYNLSRPYSYKFLNPTQKYVYDTLINAMENYKADIKIPSDVHVSELDYKTVYELLYNDEHEIYYIDTLINYRVLENGISDITINYKYSQEEFRKMQNEINRNTNIILAKITDDMTEYEIVKLFFDEIALNCTYDLESPNCSDIYGCLVNKTAICGGFAKAFSYLCSKAGIESLLITGDYDEPHMWNMVNIDSEWYHVDVTAGIVKTNTNRYARYDYFCVTDEFIKPWRTVYEQDYMYPSAVYNTYNYYNINGLTANSYDDAVRIITSEIARASQNKETVIQINCTTDEVYETVTNNLFVRKNDNALTLYEAVYPTVENKYVTSTLTYNADPETKVIKLFLVYKNN